jgi:hypothetical protein
VIFGKNIFNSFLLRRMIKDVFIRWSNGEKNRVCSRKASNRNSRNRWRKNMTGRQVHFSKGMFISVCCGPNIKGLAVIAYGDILSNHLVGATVFQNPSDGPYICRIENHNTQMWLRPANRLILGSHSQLYYSRRRQDR